MEFWGVEVKPGQAVKVDEMELGGLIHISQVALGEASKKDKSNEPAVVYLKVGEQKLVLGTLIRDDIPHLSLDIVLDKEFELSHTSKNASIYFVGYSAEDDSDDAPFGDDDDDFIESDEDVALTGQDNGKPEAKAEKPKVTEANKAAAGASAKHVKITDAKIVEEDDDSQDDSDDDEDNETDDEDESEMDADSDEEDESDEDDEETPVKKVDQGKKRPNESASKTPVSAKKAKNATPEKKIDSKKHAHTATPHPAKKGAKTPNSAAKGQSPSSGGHLSCKSCSKTFNNESGLQQHKKAKHGQ